ncbi:MAG: DUF1073 domain-containing protein [Chthoniobacterales bacterium]|nr:DUF1073 domain-containing protein [Chthoniobacterales bacterium]
MGKALAALVSSPEKVRNIEYQAKLDSWANDRTGFGTLADKTQYGYFQPLQPLNIQELANVYHGDSMAARMVDVVPQEIFREGFELDADGDHDVNDWLAEKSRVLDIRGKLQEGWTWGDLFGGGAVLIGADDGRSSSMPLVPERAKAVSYLYALDRRMLWPWSYYTEPGHPKLGQVEQYQVTSASSIAGPVQIVHESRLLIFRGAPTGIRERVMLNSWDYSVLQRPHEVLRQYNVGWNSLEIMMTDGNLSVFKMRGLSEAIAAGGSAAIAARMSLINQSTSNIRALVLDAGDPSEAGSAPEEFNRQQLSYEGIPQALDKLMLRLASAVQIPVTILMGQSPAGMSATGDSDFRWFYDRIRSLQTNKLAPHLRRLTQIMLATKESPMRSAPKSINIRFPDLWRETPAAEAARRLANAQADSAYVSAGILTPEEVALARFGGDGYGENIRLSDEAKQAREGALSMDMEKLAEGDPEPPDALITDGSAQAPADPTA